MPPAGLTNCGVSGNPLHSKSPKRESDLAAETFISLIRRTLDSVGRNRLAQTKNPDIPPEALAILTSTSPSPFEDRTIFVPLPFLLETLAANGIDVNRLVVPLSSQVEARSPSFGAVLKSLREGKNLTQQGLADKSGVAVSSIIQYEAGRRSPSLTVASKLAKALEVELDRFAECE